jgi:hypothetical protein
MKKSDQVTYHRKGWKPSTLTVADADDTKGTVDLANAAGKVVVTGCPLFLDPSKVEKLPDGYATPIAPAAPVPAPEKKAPKP